MNDKNKKNPTPWLRPEVMRSSERSPHSTTVARWHARTPVAKASSAQYLADRKNLPYGIWFSRDGRQTLFNRDYEALWTRYPGQPATRMSFEKEHFDYDEQETVWFYNDSNPPWINCSGHRQAVAHGTKLLVAWILQEFTRGANDDE